jgi:hypothetical protein
MPRGPSDVKTDEARAMLPRLSALLLAPDGRRADVTDLLLTLKDQGAEAGEDAKRLGTWTERVRHTAIALQHDCTYAYFTTEFEPDHREIETVIHRGTAIPAADDDGT